MRVVLALVVSVSVSLALASTAFGYVGTPTFPGTEPLTTVTGSGSPTTTFISELETPSDWSVSDLASGGGGGGDLLEAAGVIGAEPLIPYIAAGATALAAGLFIGGAIDYEFDLGTTTAGSPEVVFDSSIPGHIWGWTVEQTCSDTLGWSCGNGGVTTAAPFYVAQWEASAYAPVFGSYVESCVPLPAYISSMPDPTDYTNIYTDASSMLTGSWETLTSANAIASGCATAGTPYGVPYTAWEVFVQSPAQFYHHFTITGGAPASSCGSCAISVPSFSPSPNSTVAAVEAGFLVSSGALPDRVAADTLIDPSYDFGFGLVLPEPSSPNETCTSYISDLDTLGYTGTATCTAVSEDLGNPSAGPDAPIEVRDTTTTTIDSSLYPFPSSPPTIPFTDPLTILENPDDYPVVATTGGGSGCDCGSVSMTPLESLDYGSKFPFGIFTWVQTNFGAFDDGTATAPDFTLTYPWGGTLDISLASTSWEDTYRPIVFPVVEFIATFLAIFFLAIRLIGYE